MNKSAPYILDGLTDTQLKMLYAASNGKARGSHLPVRQIIFLETLSRHPSFATAKVCRILNAKPLTISQWKDFGHSKEWNQGKQSAEHGKRTWRDIPLYVDNYPLLEATVREQNFKNAPKDHSATNEQSGYILDSLSDAELRKFFHAINKPGNRQLSARHMIYLEMRSRHPSLPGKELDLGTGPNQWYGEGWEEARAMAKRGDRGWREIAKYRDYYPTLVDAVKKQFPEKIPVVQEEKAAAVIEALKEKNILLPGDERSFQEAKAASGFASEVSFARWQEEIRKRRDDGRKYWPGTER